MAPHLALTVSPIYKRETMKAIDQVFNLRLDQLISSYDLTLQENLRDAEMYQIRWQFDGSNCQNRFSCFSAKLNRLRVR